MTEGDYDDEGGSVRFSMRDGEGVMEKKKTSTSRGHTGKFNVSDLEDAMLPYFRTAAECRAFIGEYMKVLSMEVAAADRYELLRLGNIFCENRTGLLRHHLQMQGREERERRHAKFSLHSWIRERMRNRLKLKLPTNAV